MADLLATHLPQNKKTIFNNEYIKPKFPKNYISKKTKIEKKEFQLKFIDFKEETKKLVEELEGFQLYSSKYKRKQILEEEGGPDTEISEVKLENMPTPYPKQREFMESQADITFFGGAAGGAKSWALLLDFCQPSLIKNSNYGGIIFRRTFPQIRNEGGLWEESGKIYSPLGAIANQSRLVWKFPTKATIRFSHLQHEKDVYSWQGSQLPRIGFDELTHFTESQFFYLLSRNRSPYGIPPKIKCTTNPDADSWVANFVEWYLDSDGNPDPEKAGKIRYFIREEGEIIWGNSPEEISEKVNQDLESISQKIKSFKFLPASIYDNPELLNNDPGYLANLEALHPVEKARLLGGNWKARWASGTIFNREWFQIENPKQTTSLCRFWDFAASTKEINNQFDQEKGFYTVGVLIGKVPGDPSYFQIKDIVIEKTAPGTLDDLVRKTALRDGNRTKIRWELEGGAAASHFEELLKKKLRNFDAKGVRPLGDKVTRSINSARLAYNGNITLEKKPWNNEFLQAVQAFDGSPKPKTNDITDALNGAIAELDDSDEDIYRTVFRSKTF